MSTTGISDAMTTQLPKKPMVKYNPVDWHTNKAAISNDAEKTRNVSFQVRQEGRYMNNETANQTWWDTHDNDNRLSDRLDEIEEWRQILRYQVRDIDTELEAARVTKNLCENRLNDMKISLDVNLENHVTREGRMGVDLVRDGPEAELTKETEVIDAIKRNLHQKCQHSFEQLNRLQECRQQLLNDLNDKNTNFAIDTENRELDKYSSAITFKPNPLRIPKGTMTPQQWLAHSKYNKDKSDAEMHSSKRLRENIQQTIAQSNSDLDSQKNATEYAMRKRIHETEQAHDELHWQKKNTEKEIAQLEVDIENLEQAIRDKDPVIKLAHTRLENRTYRPGMELVRDEVQYGLVDEVKQLEASQKSLYEKCKQQKHAWNLLQEQLRRINEDIALKDNSLTLEKRALATRKRLNTVQIPQTETDKNFILTGVDKTGLGKVLGHQYA